MNDEGGPRLKRKRDRRSSPTRRTVLAGASAAIGLAAGCTDAGPGDDDESNAVDPEPIDDEDEVESDPTDDDASSDDSSDDSSENGTETEGDDEPSEEADEPEEELDEDTDDADEEDREQEADDEADEEVEQETDDEADEEVEQQEADEPKLEHPSARNMDHSPVRGPEPTAAEATLIVFDNPACPACAQFEVDAFDDLQDHADAGELSIVWRGVPAIEEWATAALQVLWATYERDVEAFWTLRAHAFEIQDEIDGDDEAIDRLIEYLAETTSVDTEAIRAEAEDAAYDRRVALDEDAAARGGIDATPYSFLFRSTEFRTEIRGAEDYRVYASALEL